MEKRFWRIRGYKKYETIFDDTIPMGSITDDQLKELLKCLVANGSLSYIETVGAYVKRKTKRAHEILHVNSNGTQPGYFCGTDPNFIAFIVNENGDRVVYPTRFECASPIRHKAT